jgi:hypothetical protein
MGNRIGLFNKKSNDTTIIRVEPALSVVTNTVSPDIQPTKAPTMRSSKTFTFESVLPATPVTYVSTTTTISMPPLVLTSAVNTRVAVSKIALQPFAAPIAEPIAEPIEQNSPTHSISSDDSVSSINEPHPASSNEIHVPNNSPVSDHTVHNVDDDHTGLYKKMSHLML